jgi:hypothetical protein
MKLHRTTLLVLAAATLALGGCGDDTPRDYSLTNQEVQTAKAGAADFVKGTNNEVRSVSPQDSVPVNGYVSVTIRDRTGTKPDETIECAYRNSMSGCRLKTSSGR